MESPQVIELIIQGGAVGLCVLLIILNYRKDRMYNKTINNHLDHNNDALLRNAHSHEKLAIAMQDLRGVIGGCPRNKLNQ